METGEDLVDVPAPSKKATDAADAATAAAPTALRPASETSGCAWWTPALSEAAASLLMMEVNESAGPGGVVGAAKRWDRGAVAAGQ